MNNIIFDNQLITIMLIPLTQFICDHCGDVIDTPAKAYLEWENFKDSNDISRARNFKIVHHDPSDEKICITENYATKSLEDFIGTDGISALLSFIDPGEIVEPLYKYSRALNIREFIDIFRRLTIPYYEEGRAYLNLALEDNYISQNQYGIYKPDKLQAFIEKYGPTFTT